MARYVQMSLGVLAVLVFMAASGAMNAHFWLHQGKSDLEGQILAAVSLAGDLFKAMLPFFIAGAFAKGRYVQGFVGSGLFVLVLAFSLISALGFAAGNRGAVSGSREAVNARYEAIQTELSEVDIQISKIGTIQDTRIVEASIKRHKQDLRWSTSKECTDATAGKSREFCAEYFALQGQLAAGSAGARLQERQAELRGQIAKLRTQGAGQASDPQASLLAKLIPLGDASLMQTVVMVLIAVMVELVAAFGLWLATGLGGKGDEARQASAIPAAVPVQVVDTTWPSSDVREIVAQPGVDDQSTDEAGPRRRRPVARPRLVHRTEAGEPANDARDIGTGAVIEAVAEVAARPAAPAKPERFRLEQAQALLSAPAG